MKLRATLHLNDQPANLTIFTGLQETWEHLVLKLAASLFFFESHPTIEMGATHPALQGQEYYPDLFNADLTNQPTLWVECGKTTLHKLEKISKRFRQARVIVLTPFPHQARQQAEGIEEEGLRVSVWSFADGEFERWKNLVQEKNEIIGEASETALNLVINEQSFMTELQKILP
ncbi:MAG: YaeQ family protein [Elusimicrobiota bacterium]|jgi:uncharacterized protein YaeQ